MDISAAVYESYAKFVPPQQTIYLACSGGRDSMALLFICYQLRLPVQVIHVNHQLQSMSDDWQRLVQQVCQRYQIPCHSVRLTWQLPRDAVNEQHARTARYQAMLKLTGEQAIIATAHHANDQVETLLLNLCQGTGLNGLVGMSDFGEQREFGQPFQLWRPLLNVTREHLTDWVQQHQLAYVDDPTNQMASIDTGNQRAFLREHILPLLQARFPSVMTNIQRTQTNLAQAKKIIAEQTELDLAACQLRSTPDNGTTEVNNQQRLDILNILDIKALRKLSVARRYQLLHTWVKGEQKFAPARQLICQIDALITSDNAEQQAIIGWQGFQIRRYRNSLYRLTPREVAHLAAAHPVERLPIGRDRLPNAYRNFPIRRVKPNEAFCRFGQSFHEPFKKICQRLGVPSWERPLARVLFDATTHASVALVLPNQLVWLAAADEFIIKNTPSYARLSD